MPVAPSVITQNFLTGADVDGSMPLVDGKFALFRESWISLSGGQTLTSKPATTGGAILDPAELARVIDRGSRGAGKFDRTTDVGGFNQFGYSLSQLVANLPGATSATLQLVNTQADLSSLTASPVAIVPVPDGIRKKFQVVLPANAIPNTVKLTFSNGVKFVDDGNGLFVRVNADGSSEGPSTRCGYCEYGNAPFGAVGRAYIEFADPPVVGVTATLNISSGAVAPAVVDVWEPIAPLTPDAFIWGAGRDEGPIYVPVGFYLRLVATPVLTAAGYLTAFVGGLQTQGYGANVYGFAKRERAL